MTDDNLDTDATRKRIEAAALKLIGQVGYKRATTRRIAEEAGVNEVTLFRHFGTKKNLLEACVRDFNAEGFAANLNRYLTGHYPDDIEALARASMRDMAESAEYLRLLLCDSMEVPELRAAMVQGAGDNLALVASFFQAQIEAGVVRAGLDPETLAHAFDSLFSSYVLFQSVFQTGADSLPPESTLKQLVDIFVLGTMNR